MLKKASFILLFYTGLLVAQQTIHFRLTKHNKIIVKNLSVKRL